MNEKPLITDLFRQAITHFKVFNCKRMKQYLSKLCAHLETLSISNIYKMKSSHIKGVCMAEEFYYARNYQESLK